MKARAIFLSLVAASFLSVPALAQSQSSYKEQSQTSDKDQKARTTQLTGCLSQQGGDFILTNKQYPEGVKLSSTENLKDHVGHKVEVTGTFTTLPRAGTTQGNEKQNEMKVTNFKHIASTCDTTSAAGTKY